MTAEESRAPVIRAATAADIEAITAIYADAVLHGTGTFEIDPPDVSEMTRRLARIVGAGYPYLVATDAGTVLGYAYANAYRDRPAYRFTVEDSVYVQTASRGRGVGRGLLEALVVAATAGGYRQMVAVIGDGANAGSIALHAGVGFSRAGVLRACGWKAGRWLDAVMMQRALGDGANRAPEDAARRPT